MLSRPLLYPVSAAALTSSGVPNTIAKLSPEFAQVEQLANPTRLITYCSCGSRRRATANMSAPFMSSSSLCQL